MKKTLLFVIGLFMFGGISAQNCHGTKEFTAFASDKEFVSKHEAPQEMVFNDTLGKMIEIPVEGGASAKAYFIPSAKKSDKYLFLFHEWWGLNDYVKKEGLMAWKELGDVNIIALDLYDGKVTNNPEEAGKLMQGADVTRINQIINSAFKYVGKKAKIAVSGWCFGGGWSLQAAISGNKQVKACVMYYGMPEKDLNRLAELKAPVLFIFANQDQWINKEVKDAFVADMKKASKKLEVKEYEADHAFGNPSNPKYNEGYALDARNASIAFIKANL